MENIEYSNSLYQINEILKYMEPNLKARIPKKFISYFENNKSQEYNWNIDKSLPLEKQDLFINSSLAQMGSSLLWSLFSNGLTENRGFFLNLKNFHSKPINL